MKWLGALLFVCASYLFGKRLSKDEEERLLSVDSLIRLLTYMKRRINSERTPLFELFSSFRDGYFERIGVLEEINRNRDISEEKWERVLSLMSFDADIKTELLRFFTELGTLQLEDQLKRIDYIVSLLSERQCLIKKELPDKQKTIKTVCLLAGMLTTIILL